VSQRAPFLVLVKRCSEGRVPGVAPTAASCAASSLTPWTPFISAWSQERGRASRPWRSR